MKILVSILAFTLCAVAHGTPTFDAYSASSVLGADTDTASINHALGSGSNRIVACGAQSEDQLASISGITFNGVAMTATQVAATTQGNNTARTYYMLEPQLPAAGTYPVVATFSDESTNVVSITCISSSDALQGAPDEVGNTATSGSSISNTMPFAEVGDILFKVMNSNAIRTNSHGAWDEIMDLQANVPTHTDDSSHTAAYFVVTTQGTQVATTTLSGSTSRMVQLVLRIESAFVSPDVGTTILMQACPGAGVPAYRAANVCGPSGSEDCCPPILDAPVGSAAAYNAVAGTVDTTHNWGSIYYCLTTSATPKTCAEIVAGTGCAVSNNSAVANARAALSGAASESTAYYWQTAQPLDRPDCVPTVSAAFTTPASPEPSGITYTGGHWIAKDCRELNNRVCDWVTNSTLMSSDVAGVLIFIEWRDLEGSVDNQWINWDRLKTTTDALSAAGKKFAFQPFWTTFGQGGQQAALSCLTATPTINCNPMTPTHMWNNCAKFGGNQTLYPNVRCGSYVAANGDDIYTNKTNPNVLIQIGEFWAKMNTEYGDDPDFNGLFISETTTSGGTPDDGWTASKAIDALLEIASMAREELPTKPVFMMTNFINHESQFNGDEIAFMQYLVDNFDVWVSWPDTPSCPHNAGTIAAFEKYAQVMALYGGTNKLFPQQQGPDYKNQRVACLPASNWIDDMYDVIVEELDPNGVIWSDDFSANTTTTNADLYDLINGGLHPLPAP